MTNLLNIFPRYLLRAEGKKIKKYLDQDLSTSAVKKRVENRIDNNVMDDELKLRVFKAMCEVVDQVISKGIPPYLLEKNLLKCSEIRYIEIEEMQIQNNSVINSAILSRFICNPFENKLWLIQNNEKVRNKLKSLNMEYFLDRIEGIDKHEIEHMASFAGYNKRWSSGFQKGNDLVGLNEAYTEQMATEGFEQFRECSPRQLILELLQTITDYDFAYVYYTANYNKLINIISKNHDIFELKKIDQLFRYYGKATSTDTKEVKEEAFQIIFDIYVDFCLKKNNNYEENREKSLSYYLKNKRKYITK